MRIYMCLLCSACAITFAMHVNSKSMGYAYVAVYNDVYRLYINIRLLSYFTTWSDAIIQTVWSIITMTTHRSDSDYGP
jgi:hypothetical protein